jgi:hypothetical protein
VYYKFGKRWTEIDNQKVISGDLVPKGIVIIRNELKAHLQHRRIMKDENYSSCKCASE